MKILILKRNVLCCGPTLRVASWQLSQLRYNFSGVNNMKILALEMELPGADKASFKALAKEEAARAWDLYQEGVIRELYFRQDRPESVLVLECAGVEEARHILATLPFVEAGLIDFELIPLVAYPGFERLFG